MARKTIGKIALGVISVAFALFTLSMGISHYIQHSTEKVNNVMAVDK